MTPRLLHTGQVRFLAWLVSQAAALGLSIWLLGGLQLHGTSTGDRLWRLLVVACILGAVSAVVKPLVQLLSLPVIVLSLGLFLFVINGLMLLLVSKISGSLDLGFHVDGFWAAVWGSIVITVIGWVVDLVLDRVD